ncbi:hypothetical protein OPV22_026158 [Ensete ventricosum]|uniref:carbonic anhydrase n=1 Tax=Ensete ventricosum TaxID=4639 RepID=A0AAV8QJA6_ENSVE|nr:hypothetical protein OPV22_026158 [Ensete ventricosum]
MASLLPSPLSFAAFDASSAEASSRFFWKPLEPSKIGNSSLNLVRTSNARLKIRGSVEEKHTPAREASKEPFRLTRKLTESERQVFEEEGQVFDPFQELECRFKRFKSKNYVENLVDYQNLAERQSPKFMVIACADSRVCPSNILGFQPGESFMVRNVANLVPPFQHGASETSAALEFAVENILIVGHSRCGGIQALMSMKDNADSRSFIKDWVSIGKSARLSTKAAAGNLSFEMQCRHCEKESINGSLLNLLTYPWIEKRFSAGAVRFVSSTAQSAACSADRPSPLSAASLTSNSSRLRVRPPTVTISARTALARTDRTARLSSPIRLGRSAQHTHARTTLPLPPPPPSSSSSSSTPTSSPSPGTITATSSTLTLSSLTCLTTSPSSAALSNCTHAFHNHQSNRDSMKQASRSMHERAHATYPGGRGEQAPEGGEVAIDPLPTSPLRLAVAPHGSRLPRRPHLMHRLAGRKRLHSDTNSPPPAAAWRPNH